MRWRVYPLLGVAIASAVACSEPLEFADWTIPVPEGTPIKEYAGVPIREREGDPIEVVEDLVIGEREGDSNYSFYGAIDLGVDAGGRIYVYDSGNRRIQVFSERGDYVRTIGREGSGPGETEGGGRIAIVGDRLVLSSGGRLNTWQLDGRHLGMFQQVFSVYLFPIAGTDDGSLVGAFPNRFGEEERFRRIALISLEAEVAREYPAIRDLGWVSFRRPNRGVNTFVPGPQAAFALSRDGSLYVADGEEYQVAALSLDGQTRWALRVAWSRELLTDERIAIAMERVRERIPDARSSEVDWPEYLPALESRRSSLRVDGHGHLYVFPLVPHDWDREDRPVDVYSPDGERLVSGLMRAAVFSNWRRARGDYVYTIEDDPDTEEQIVVRYRLVEPFDG